MGTPSGYAAFLDPEVNVHLKKILNEWGKFLMSPKSAEVLGDSKQGWFGEHGTSDMMSVANAPYGTKHSFDDFFVVPDPKGKHRGYKSWDHFFTVRSTGQIDSIRLETDTFRSASLSQTSARSPRPKMTTSSPMRARARPSASPTT